MVQEIAVVAAFSTWVVVVRGYAILMHTLTQLREKMSIDNKELVFFFNLSPQIKFTVCFFLSLWFVPVHRTEVSDSKGFTEM